MKRVPGRVALGHLVLGEPEGSKRMDASWKNLRLVRLVRGLVCGGFEDFIVSLLRLEKVGRIRRPEGRSTIGPGDVFYFCYCV